MADILKLREKINNTYEWENSFMFVWEASKGGLCWFICPPGKAEPEGDAPGKPDPIYPGEGDGLIFLWLFIDSLI